MGKINGQAVLLVTGETDEQGIFASRGGDGIKAVGIAEDAGARYFLQTDRGADQDLACGLIADGAADGEAVLRVRDPPVPAAALLAFRLNRPSPHFPALRPNHRIMETCNPKQGQ